jgi:hypothetical protein
MCRWPPRFLLEILGEEGCDKPYQTSDRVPRGQHPAVCPALRPGTGHPGHSTVLRPGRRSVHRLHPDDPLCLPHPTTPPLTVPVTAAPHHDTDTDAPHPPDHASFFLRFSTNCRILFLPPPLRACGVSQAPMGAPLVWATYGMVGSSCGHLTFIVGRLTGGRHGPGVQARE